MIIKKCRQLSFSQIIDAEKKLEEEEEEQEGALNLIIK